METIVISLFGKSAPVKFTKPQGRIVRRLLNGERVTYINQHWVSGGEFVWYHEDGDYTWGKESVGYRAYNGAMRAIINAFNMNREEQTKLYNNFQK